MDLKFDKRGLIPAVVQDARGRVLMLAYMNEESLRKSLETGRTWFYSRSRRELWPKGETSGNVQRVLAIAADCDRDALLVTVEQTGVACHEGDYSCFHNPLPAEGGAAPAPGREAGGPLSAGGRPLGEVLDELERVIVQRRRDLPEGSYTTRLLRGAPDAVCKKIGEEATEVVLAAKNGDRNNLAWEAADLLYHTLVLLASQGLSLQDVARELDSRRH